MPYLLGKKAAVYDPRTVKLADYLAAAPSLPAVRDGRMPPSPRPHVAPGDLLQIKGWVREALSDVALNLH